MTAEELKKVIKKEIESLVFANVTDDESLLKSKTMDSISIVDLAVAIESEFKIKIQAAEINETNFETVNIITDFILHKINAK